VTAIEREAEAPPASGRTIRRPWTLGGAFAALALVALDVAAVPAALPSARVELGSSTSGLVWMQEAYLLALAVALVLLAQASARLDRRLLAATGLLVFAGGALLASAAGGTAALVTGRALQGAGSAALLVPALANLERAAGERRRLPAMLAAAAALLALAIAPLVGGAVTEAASWRWLLRLELVAAAPVALLLLTRPPPEPVGGVRRPAALVAGLACAVTGLIQSGAWGWASADTLLLLAAGGGLLAFAWRDGVGAATAAALVGTGCLAAMLLLTPQYFELARGLSPWRSGLLTVALTGAAAALALLAGLAAGRAAAGSLLPAGLACAAVGALGAIRIDPASSYALVVVSLGLVGGGIGTAAGALASGAHGPAADPALAPSARAPAPRDGAHGPAGDRALAPSARAPAPRDLATSAAAGAALVVAAAGALFQRAQTDERDSGGSFEDALAAGLSGSAWLLAALLAVAALLAWRR
jgi:MFS family permease